MKAALLLLALAAGYGVLTLSDKQKRPLNVLGRIIGAVILLVSIAGLICSAVFGYCRWKGCDGAGASGCLWQKKASCEYVKPQGDLPK